MDDFNPYYKWLGIPLAEQPPNHYRLLGVNLFEPDLDVIDSAAEARMAQLRTYQIGPRKDQSQKLLKEVAHARLTLLDPRKRAAYDRSLRTHLSSPESSPGDSPLTALSAASPAPPPPPVVSPDPATPSRLGSASRFLSDFGAQRARQFWSGGPWSFAVSLLGGMILTLAIGFVAASLRDRDNDNAAPPNAQREEPVAPSLAPAGS